MILGKIGTYISKSVSSIVGCGKTTPTPFTPRFMMSPPVSDSLDISQQNRIIQNMLEQRRKMVNTVHEDISVEETLDNIKAGDKRVNLAIRLSLFSRTAASEPKETLAERYDALVAQSVIPESVSLYRGGAPIDFGFVFMTTEKFIEKFYKKGRYFKIPIFFETSLDRSIGDRFARDKAWSAEKGILFKINCPKGTHGIYMENLTTVENATRFDEEKEIFLARDLTCRFKSHTSYNPYEEIEIDVVEEVPFYRRVHKFWEES